MGSRKKSRDFAAGENIGPEVISTNLVASHVLNGGPPLGIEQDFASEPIRDGLLANGRAIKEVGYAFRKRRLTPSNIDSPLQRSNVINLHDYRKYTRILVTVNNHSSETCNKHPCIVSTMPAAKKKAVVKERPRQGPAPEIGPDGFTFGQRLLSIMEDRGIGQTKLARMCSDIYARVHPRVTDRVQQQHIGNIISKNQRSSEYLPLITEALNVYPLWLQFGFPPKEPEQIDANLASLLSNLKPGLKGKVMALLADLNIDDESVGK